MAQVRQAEANWSGDLLGGGGSVSATSSGIFSDQAITWRARTEAAEGKTSPEELLDGAAVDAVMIAVPFFDRQAAHSAESGVGRITVHVDQDVARLHLVELVDGADWKPEKVKKSKSKTQEVSRMNFIEACDLVTQEDEKAH